MELEYASVYAFREWGMTLLEWKEANTNQYFIPLLNYLLESLLDPRRQDAAFARRQVHDKERSKSLASEDETFIGEHINYYTKIIACLANMKEMINDEDKAFILLSSLPDEEYETFVLTLIDGK